jgi:hypothetical protein
MDLSEAEEAPVLPETTEDGELLPEDKDEF